MSHTPMEMLATIQTLGGVAHAGDPDLEHLGTLFLRGYVEYRPRGRWPLIEITQDGYEALERWRVRERLRGES